MPLLADTVDAVLEGSVVGSFTRIGSWVRRHTDDWTPLEDLPGAGKTVLVTGANSGLGYATAAALVRAGAAVRLLVRNQLKGEDARDRLVARHPGADLDVYVADMSDLAQVRAVAARIREREGHLDGLVHNAGAMFRERRETAAGIERTVALHVVGPHLLTRELADLLGTSAGRVVWVASGGMYTQPLSVRHLQSPSDYRPSVAYARAKRAQVVLAAQWQQRVGDTSGFDVHAMHPGWALTPGVSESLPVFRRVMGPLLRGATDGADTTVWLCLAPEVANQGGQFWLDRRPRSTVRLPRTATEQHMADALWDEVERLADL
jgi:dehydrogenase/reductase SDR family member 12